MSSINRNGPPTHFGKSDWHRLGRYEHPPARNAAIKSGGLEEQKNEVSFTDLSKFMLGEFILPKNYITSLYIGHHVYIYIFVHFNP